MFLSHAMHDQIGQDARAQVAAFNITLPSVAALQGFVEDLSVTRQRLSEEKERYQSAVDTDDELSALDARGAIDFVEGRLAISNSRLAGLAVKLRAEARAVLPDLREEHRSKLETARLAVFDSQRNLGVLFSRVQSVAGVLGFTLEPIVRAGGIEDGLKDPSAEIPSFSQIMAGAAAAVSAHAWEAEFMMRLMNDGESFLLKAALGGVPEEIRDSILTSAALVERSPEMSAPTPKSEPTKLSSQYPGFLTRAER